MGWRRVEYSRFILCHIVQIEVIDLITKFSSEEPWQIIVTRRDGSKSNSQLRIDSSVAKRWVEDHSSNLLSHIHRLSAKEKELTSLDIPPDIRSMLCKACSVW